MCHVRWIIPAALALVVPPHSELRAQASAPLSDQKVIGYNPRADFIAYRADYPAQKRKFHDELDRLQADMIAQQRKGRKTPCTRQVFLEAKWLVSYTADAARTERKLADLRARLAAPADPHDGRQIEADGSFGCCSEIWFHKLDATVDQLIARGFWLRQPKYPVKLLEQINSPEKLRAYLDSVLIADVRHTGVDTRYELNGASSALQRIILWSGTLKELPTKITLHPGLKDALLDYEDNRWQDPQTGYWGTWYRTADGSIVKTSDLSQTFHLVSYRDGHVNRWPLILKTTLAIKDQEYPYGWLEDGKLSNHHNYDVVRLFHLGWPEATPAQRAGIRSEIARMLKFCLDETLDADGTFKFLGDEDTLGSTFYFGVAFLHEIGYFSRTGRFWTDQEFPDAAKTRDKIEARMRALGLDDPESTFALKLLHLDRLRP